MWSSCETSNGDFKRSGIDRTKSQNGGPCYRNTSENRWLRVGKWSYCFERDHFGREYRVKPEES